MKSKLIIDGNAFYEVDEECLEKKRQEEKKPLFGASFLFQN